MNRRKNMKTKPGTKARYIATSAAVIAKLWQPDMKKLVEDGIREGLSRVDIKKVTSQVVKDVFDVLLREAIRESIRDKAVQAAKEQMTSMTADAIEFLFKQWVSERPIVQAFSQSQPHPR